MRPAGINQKVNEQLGLDFDIAPDGQQAIELAKMNESNYDICLMDIDMPVMNGFEATKIIRQKMKYFPIMALTGNCLSKDEYLRTGMDGYLQKPYRAKDLYDKIIELTAKYFRVLFIDDNFFINEELPMNQQHANELRELAKEGLCKLNIRGIGAHDVMIVAHKNVPYKISHDFIENNEEVSIFLDRSKDKPAECHLYKSSCPMPTIYLQEEEFEVKRKIEDDILKLCSEMVTKKKSTK